MVLRDPEARLPHTAAIRLWPTVGDLTNDPNIGLHIAEAIQPGQFGALDYALRTSANLEEAFRRLSRYHRLLHDAAKVELEVDRDRTILSHRLPLPGDAPRPVSEFILAAWLVASRQATGVNCAPLQVCFPHAGSADTSEHRRVFGCPLKFGHSRSELILSRELLDLPLPCRQSSKLKSWRSLRSCRKPRRQPMRCAASSPRNFRTANRGWSNLRRGFV
jgi:hypothetical protein